MVNLPGETEETLKKTLRGVTAMHPEGCRIYPLLVIEGTKLADWYRKGCYTPLDLAETVRRCAYLYEGLTAAGIPVIRMGLQPDEDLSAGQDSRRSLPPLFWGTRPFLCLAKKD